MRGLLALPVLAVVLGTAVGAGARDAACGWNAVSDVPGTTLLGVSAVSDQDVWAVGSKGSEPVILHWNGRRWILSRSAVVGLDVDVISARDVWVVGETSSNARVARPASEHWDGVRWKIVSVPGGAGSYLRAVSAAWAVGAGTRGPLVVHRIGSAWRVVPAGAENGLLHGIDPPWAVGTTGTATATTSEDPLVARIAGGSVTRVTTPILDSVDENLLAVSADSTGDVWAVGSEDVLGGRAPLVQHFDGTVWSDESVAGLPPSRSALAGVAAFGPSDVWVAGYRGFADQRAMLAHWNGSRWTQGRATSGALFDLSALSPHDIWAAGEAHVATGTRSLVERYACR